MFNSTIRTMNSMTPIQYILLAVVLVSVLAVLVYGAAYLWGLGLTAGRFAALRARLERNGDSHG